MAATKRAPRSPRRRRAASARPTSSRRASTARTAAARRRKAAATRATTRKRKTATRATARKNKKKTMRSAKRRPLARRASARRPKSGTRRVTTHRKTAPQASATRGRKKTPAAPRQPRPTAIPSSAATAKPAPRPRKPAAPRTAHARQAAPPVQPTLDRERRRLPDDERLEDTAALPTADDRLIAAARTGHAELREDLIEHTETSPRLTAGDIDADWQDAYAVGDEAPGGDNPTPDQDRVEDIGRALGVNYQDNEELRSTDKISDRDRHRWELDPASSDDWPHGRKGGSSE